MGFGFISKDTSTPSSEEDIRDVIGAALVEGTGIDITVSDVGNTITIAATGSQNSFSTITTPSGTSPVADSATDTLDLATANNRLSITGDATNDRVTFTLNEGNIVHNNLSGLTTGDPHTQYALYAFKTIQNSALSTMADATTRTDVLQLNSDSSTVEILGSSNQITFDVVTSNLIHNDLSGLTSGDPHTQYAYLAGRVGNQTLIGGTAASGTLTLQSTANATRGKVLFGSASAYDEVNDRIGIATTSPSEKLHLGSGTIRVASLSTGLVHSSSTGVFSSSLLVNADVDAAAAIDWSKLATGGANRVPYLNASGVLTHSSSLTFTESGGSLQFNGTAAGIVINDTDNSGYIRMYYANTSSNRFDIAHESGNSRFATMIASGSTILDFSGTPADGTSSATVRFNRWCNTTGAVLTTGMVGNNTTTTAWQIAHNAAGTATIFNEQGVDIDFRIESDNQTHLFFLDASTDRIGIGSSGPTETFHQALGNHLHEVSSSGVTITSTLGNSSNTSSSQAQQVIRVAGTSAGDAFQTFTITGATSWSHGIDNSVSGDPFVVSASAALGTSDIMSLTTTGVMTVGGTAGQIILYDSDTGPNFQMRYANTSSNRFDITQNDGNTRIFGIKNANNTDAQTFDINALSGSAGASTIRFNRDVSTSAATTVNFYRSDGTTNLYASLALNAAATITSFNNTSDDIDFQIKGDTLIPFYIDAGNDRVGLFTSSPSERLHLASGNFLHEVSSSGATISHTLSNSSNSASAKANFVIKTAGTTADDPFITFQITSGSPANFSLGQDNSDSDKFKISRAATLGTNDCIVIDGSSNVGIGGSPSFPFDVPTASSNARIGTAELGCWPGDSTYAYFGNEALTHNSSGGAGNYALLQEDGGDTFLNAPSGKTVYFRNSNATKGELGTLGWTFYVEHYTEDYLFRVNDNSFTGSDMMRIDPDAGGFETPGYILFDPDTQGFPVLIGTTTLNDSSDMLTVGSGNVRVKRSISGNYNSLSVQNSSNTASSHAAVYVEVGGSSAGDAVHIAAVSGVLSWTWGLDNSDSDAWVLSRAFGLGSSNCIRIDSTRVVDCTMGVKSDTRVQIPNGSNGDKLNNNGDVEVSQYTGVPGIGFQESGTKYYINSSGVII